MNSPTSTPSPPKLLKTDFLITMATATRAVLIDCYKSQSVASVWVSERRAAERRIWVRCVPALVWAPEITGAAQLSPPSLWSAVTGSRLTEAPGTEKLPLRTDCCQKSFLDVGPVQWSEAPELLTGCQFLLMLLRQVKTLCLQFWLTLLFYLKSVQAHVGRSVLFCVFGALARLRISASRL